MAQPSPTPPDARSVGAFYTDSETAAFMVRWLLRGGETRCVLEPSFGEGVFLSALKSADPTLDVRGVELIPETHARTISQGLISAEAAVLSDFLAVPPQPVDAVIGNPPYIRLRNIDKPAAARALAISKEVMGRRMETSGSIWMPFILHATRFLRPGGRLAFVLPFDVTYVKYARSLWAHLGQNFRQLRLIRVRQRLFPDILQQVVLLLADGFGGTTPSVTFEAFETIDDMATGEAITRSSLSIARIAAGNRDFLRAHLSDPLRALLDRLEPQLQTVRETCRFNIGYVCGHKGYFHPDSQTLKDYRIPASSTLPALASSRALTGSGIFTRNIPDDRRSTLFYPPREASQLTAGEHRYIKHGESEAVHQRYKCRVREPWYVVPWVKKPQLILSVFAERPILALNDAGLYATNSLLTGYLEGDTAEAFAAKWYTSLTLLSCELEIHSLGGGVMILIPGETGSLQLSRTLPPPPAGHLEAIDRKIRGGAVEDAYRLGDAPILQRGLGLSTAEVGLIREGVETLAAWRRASS